SRSEYASLSLHDALPILRRTVGQLMVGGPRLIDSIHLDRLGRFARTIKRFRGGGLELERQLVRCDSSRQLGIARPAHKMFGVQRSEEHTSELQSRGHLVC